MGVDVFFSAESIQEEGSSDFIDLINEALNSARILVCIASSADSLNSNWPSYERKKFFNDIMSNRKDGDIFTVLNGFDPLKLPDPLTSYQFFGKEQLDHLYRTILSNLDKNKPLNSNVNLTPYDFSKQKLDGFLTRNHYVRDCINGFVSNYLVSDDRCCFLCGKKGIGISTFLATIAEELLNSKTVLYVSDITEMNLFHDIIESGSLSHVIIDAIKEPEQLESLKKAVVVSKSTKFICGISISLERSIMSIVKSSFPFVVFKIPPLSFEEISAIVLEDLDTQAADPLLRFLKRNQISFFSTTSVLVLLKLLVRDGVDFSSVGILDVFSLLEEKMETTETISTLNRLLDEIMDSCNYPEIPLSVLENNRAYSMLVDSGIIEKKLNKYKFSESDLPIVNFMFASRMFSRFDAECDLSLLSEKEAVIPLYFGLISKNDVFRLIEYDFSGFPIQLLFKIMNYSFADEECIIEMCINQTISDNVLSFVQFKTDHGQYDYSYWLLGILDSNNLISKSDYEAEKLILDYYAQGAFNYDEHYLDNCRYRFYCGRIEYNADHYDSANKHIRRALELSNDESKYFVDFMKLNYIEVLMDCNEVGKATELIDELEKSPNLSETQKIQLYNYRGVMYTCQKQFGRAKACFEILFRQLELGDSSSKWYGKSYGDKALCLIYMGRYDEARECAWKNVELMLASKNYIGLTCALDLLAQTFFLQKDYKKAFKYFSIALIYARQTSNEWRSIIIRLFLTLFRFHFVDEDMDIDVIKKDIEGIDSDAILTWPYCLLSLNYWIRDEKEKAIDLYSGVYSVIEKGVDLERKDLFSFLNHFFRGDRIEGSRFAENLLNSIQGLVEWRKENPVVVPLCNMEIDSGLWLKKFLPFDYPYVFEYASDADTTKYMIWPTHRSINDSIEYINRTLKKEIETDYYCWAIELNGAIVGAIDMTWWDDCYEIGYILNKKHWRKGIMSKCVDAVIDYFKAYGFNKFIGVVFKDNIASMCLLKKKGFVQVSEQKNEEGTEEIVLIRDDCKTE